MKKVVSAIILTAVLVSGCYTEYENQAHLSLQGIQSEKATLSQKIYDYQTEVDQWNADYNKFLLMLPYDKLSAYNDLKQKCNMETPEGSLLFYQGVDNLLDAEHYGMFIALVGRQIDLTNKSDALNAESARISAIEQASLMQIQLAEQQRKESIQAFGRALQESERQRQQQKNWDNLNRNLININNRLSR